MSPDSPDTVCSAQEQRPCWFVGAVFDGKDDQTERFIKEKRWETSKDKAKKQIQDAQPGDRIAIKAAYTRKKDIPFDCKEGQSPSWLSRRQARSLPIWAMDGFPWTGLLASL